MKKNHGLLCGRTFFAAVILCAWLSGCSRSIDSPPDQTESNCTRVVLSGLDITRFNTRDEAIESLSESLRSWAFGRRSIPTVVWDVDGQQTIAEVQGYSCDHALDLLGEILGLEIQTGMYQCEECAWLN